MSIAFDRDGRRPLDILAELVRTDPEFAKAAEERGTVVRLPPAKPLAELVRHPEGADPDELLQHRFLCRGCSALLVGSTGAGKSSCAMQCAICWACGRPAFGLDPVRPLKTLIVQAENDEGDMAEMRDGVLAGLDLPPDVRDAALARIRVVSEDTKTREGFAAMLDRLLEQEPADLVIVDPAFAYLGGDASSQRDVSPFLRNMLNPVIHKHRVGLILVHHVNKPASGEQKPQWQAGDYAYLGAGSAEFANWARAVIAIRSLGSDEVFELRLAKRGRRARWKDDQGRPTNSRFIAYHREPGVICWREVSMAEVEAMSGGGKPTIQDVVDALGKGPLWRKDVAQAVMDATGLRSAAAYALIDKAIDADAVRIAQRGERGATLLRSSGRLNPRTPVADTGEEDNGKDA
jgi:hypothetical protein